MKKSTSRRKSKASSKALVPPDDDVSTDPVSVKEARRLLKNRLYGHDVPSHFWLSWGLENQRRQLKEVFEQCLNFGESNSALIIGPRGSGKTKLIESALHELKPSSGGNHFVISLNGSIQTDDRTALQEIARQLELENVTDDHVFGSFADNLAFILDSFSSGSKETRSVVVILDEFDLFAQHKNQSLIYNLLDVSRNRQTPISVIGVTCRLDIVELLEKRVKSRYSHRSILTFSSIDFEEYLEMLRAMLKLPSDFKDSNYKERWNYNVQTSTDERATRELIRKHFNKTKDIRSVALLLAEMVCKITHKSPLITKEIIIEVFKREEIDGKIQMLKGLSVLELCLVVATKHVLERRSGEPFNFDMVFKEYQNFVLKRSTTVQKFEKAVAMKAFEHLLAIEVLKPLHNVNQSTLPKEYQPMTLLADNSQISQVLSSYTGCPTDLQQWGSSTIL
eukprot:gene3653-4170_t